MTGKEHGFIKRHKLKEINPHETSRNRIIMNAAEINKKKVNTHANKKGVVGIDGESCERIIFIANKR